MDKAMTITSRVQLGVLMRHMGLPMRIAEIGVAEGRWSQEMLAWDLSELYLVDIFEQISSIEGCASFEQSWHDENYRQVNERFKDCNNVIILKGLSHKMAETVADNYLGMVYIDGDHTYNGVKLDIECWMPKLVSGGIMAFHDYGNPTYGVERRVTECFGKSNIFELPENGSLDNLGCYIIKK
jgi:hypothetical protein